MGSASGCLQFFLPRFAGEQAIALVLELDDLALLGLREVGRELLTALFAYGGEVVTLEYPPHA